MMPKFCEKCDRKNRENCSYYKSCYLWLGWFAKAWADIRKVAKGINTDPNSIRPENLIQRESKGPRRGPRASVCVPKELEEYTDE
jgi:hypothetical protein